MRGVFLVLGAVLAFGLLAVADDGSVAWPVQNSGTVIQPMYERCPPGTIYHCETICIWWHQDIDPMCVNLCEVLWWWCFSCVQSCIGGCPVVWMCLEYRTVCSCVSDIPQGLDPGMY